MNYHRRNRFGIQMAVAAGLLSVTSLIAAPVAFSAEPDGGQTTPTSAEQQLFDPEQGAPAATDPADSVPSEATSVDSDPTAVATPDVADALDPAMPQLSVTIDNGRASADVGDRLDYTVTVQNLGTADMSGLVVRQTQPAALQIESADADGAKEPGQVTWTVDLGRGETKTFHSTMTVESTPSELLRLASVACVSPSKEAPPLVCATHSDQLPAGAAAEADQAAMAQTSVPTEQNRMWWYVAGAIVVVIVAAVLVVVMIRRRRNAATVSSAEDVPDGSSGLVGTLRR